MARRKVCTVYVIEVGYVSESSARFETTVLAKSKQHRALCSALSRAGWDVHGGGPIVLLLGQAGTVFKPWDETLRLLGLPAESAVRLMNRLHLHALQIATQINASRLVAERSPLG
jgi:hypothetical protein